MVRRLVLALLAPALLTACSAGGADPGGPRDLARIVRDAPDRAAEEGTARYESVLAVAAGDGLGEPLEVREAGTYDLAADRAAGLEVLGPLREVDDDVASLGREDVRGVPTDHLAARAHGATIEVWVDDDGLVRRVVVPFDDVGAATVELYDYGGPVDEHQGDTTP